MIYAEILRKSDQDEEDNLCLCLGNRSATLFKLNEHQKCLEDIKWALERVKSNKQRTKLEKRKEQVYDFCGGIVDDISDGYDTISPFIDGDKAKATINPKDLLLTETPIPHYLNQNYYFVNCFNCFKTLKEHRYYPCYGCAQVRFCSHYCSRQSWYNGHQYFCMHLSYFDRLPAKSRNLSYIVSLIVLNSDIRQYFRQLRSGELPDLIKSYTKIPESEELVASLLTFFTSFSSFPPKDEAIAWKHDIELLAGLLMGVVAVTEERIYPVIGLRLKEYYETCEPQCIYRELLGYGLYSYLSTIQHCCSPNCAVVNDGDGLKITLRAVKKMYSGEDLSFNHNNFEIMEEDQCLRYSMKKCSCKVCSSNTKCLKSTAILCPKCSNLITFENGKCDKCEDLLDDAKIDELHGELKGAVYSFRNGLLELSRKNGNVIKAEEQLLGSYRVTRKILSPNHMMFIIICGSLSYCYKKLRNWKLSFTYSKLSWESAKERFGNLDVIYFNTLLRLIKREKDFLDWIRGKEESVKEEMKDFVKDAEEGLKAHLSEAKKLNEIIRFEKEYFQNVLNELDQ